MPLPGIGVHLDTRREMSTLPKVMVWKEPFPTEIYSYLFMGTKILPVPHAPWQPQEKTCQSRLCEEQKFGNNGKLLSRAKPLS